MTKIDRALLEAPVINVDGVAGFAQNSELVKFNLFQERLVLGTDPNNKQAMELVVCARIVMPASVFIKFAEWAKTRAATMAIESTKPYRN